MEANARSVHGLVDTVFCTATHVGDKLTSFFTFGTLHDHLDDCLGRSLMKISFVASIQSITSEVPSFITRY